MYKVFVNDSLITFSHAPAQPLNPNTHSINLNEAEATIRNLLTGEIPPGDFQVPVSETEAANFLAETFEPITAAGGVVFNAEGKILWIFRRGKWDLPKGKADEGETMEQTALREVQEECGVQQLTAERYLGHCYHIYGLKKGKLAFKTTHWYRMHTRDTEFTPQTEEDITEIRFFGPQDPEPLTNTFRSLSDFLANHSLE